MNPKKLLNSKWTAVKPEHRERHFLVQRVDINRQGQVTLCVIEAVHSKRRQNIDWKSLENAEHWAKGWLDVL